MFPNESDTGARHCTFQPVGVVTNGDVYRRLQEPEGNERSVVSLTSNDNEADEYRLLIDESVKKSPKTMGAPVGRKVPLTGGNSCTRNRIFVCAIGLFSFFTLLMMNLPLGSEKGRSGTIPGWSVNTSRLTVNYVLPSENTTIIDPLNVCATEERNGDGNENEKVFLLIVVCSSARNFDARQMIRDTWGNTGEFNYAQFSRMHARFKGEYLDPRPIRNLQDFIRQTDGGGSEPLSVAPENTKESGNKSSQGINSTAPPPPPLPSFATLEGYSFNVKVVFLLGQSETNYLRQRHKSLPDAQQQQSQTASPPHIEHNPASRGFRAKARASLFPAGGDVDPAFNVREEELDALQERILNESEVHGDIIQESFIDSYNNLTLKTIMLLKWVNNNCDGRVKYIMKCDDDTFVNVPNLLHVLLGGTVPLYKASIPFYDRNTVEVKSQKNRLVQVKRLLTGFLFCEAKPIADTSSKWYSPNYMYSKEYYPNYLSGTAYVMNMDAARLLYRTSLTTPIFHLEDVYLTGIVADRVKLRRYHHPLFFYSYTKDPCALRGMISQHWLQPNDIRNAYDFITNSTAACSGPGRNYTMAEMKLHQRKKCQ
ncbi:uncharacterized protein LOC129762027 [Toxorhynchites rutilus septentrionalis]|uniref:uncharacterized protein LOC129762027 n=1 Tax=Toxorhynchites rutilus septentrionalis TaxID=329112 RepID=UPI00247B0C1F|nr:uncharacterized protein LOC129762027 [Toxorhynchites rutilus septentrionalis]